MKLKETTKKQDEYELDEENANLNADTDTLNDTEAVIDGALDMEGDLLNENDQENAFHNFLNTSIGGQHSDSVSRVEVHIIDPLSVRNRMIEQQGKRHTTLRHRVRHLLRSGRFHLALIILVIIESLFVAGEVSILIAT
jgi:hypothetical protein